MERCVPRVALPLTAALSGLLFSGLAMTGCQASSSSDWAQTSPPIAPVETSAATISLGAWGHVDASETPADSPLIR